MIRKGLSLTELLISSAVITVMLLAFADYSAGLFQVSSDHAKLLENIDQTRLSSGQITSEVSRAAYIYPKGIDISLYADHRTLTINTSNAIALLIPVKQQDGSNRYRFTAFYFQNAQEGKANLYEFHSSYDYDWTENTLPASQFAMYNGSSSLIMSDIVTEYTSLSYTVNYDNGVSDTVLKGLISDRTETSSDALINGVLLNITVRKKNDYTYNIKGVSENVPRYIYS